ncbi:MAG TPA: hypothetical protein PK002_14160 [Cellvibrio sp.]|nr:hypothetical protein [Cellvibrio sp.]
MEVAQMSLSSINDGISSCESVLTEKIPKLWWGSEVSELVMTKDTCVLEYHRKFVAEFPTLEIYAMLKAYRGKLVEHEAEKEITQKNTK